MNLAEQTSEIIDYFRNNEKPQTAFKLGVEFEHFIVEQGTLETVSFYGQNGVEETLKEMLALGWQGDYEKNYLVGLHNHIATITLEPGSQVELSIMPQENIRDIEEEYLRFINQIVPILKHKNQVLVAMGYQPTSKIADIRFIPKQRYVYMSEYLKEQGKYAHHMMKGTASMQVSMDYLSEEDFIKKFKVANALSPVIAMLFDNSPFFEGQIWPEHALRTVIWQNCDDARCGVAVRNSKDAWGYEAYAQFILNAPPILIYKDGAMLFTGDQRVRDLFDPDQCTLKELEHMMTMVFPDVRAKAFIEIRMADACPYPLNMTCVALWKGLFYQESILNQLYQEIADVQVQDIAAAKGEVIKNGYGTRLKDNTLTEVADKLLKYAKRGLSPQEGTYLEPLEKMLAQRKSPSAITKDQLQFGKQKAVQWCVLEALEVL